MLIINAINEFSSRSVCINVILDGEENPVKLGGELLSSFISLVGQDFFANDSLPQNVSTMEGNNATFECQLGTFNPTSSSDYFILRYELAGGSNGSSENDVNQWCSAGESEYCWTTNSDDANMYLRSVDLIESQNGFKRYTFTFQVLNLGPQHHNSVFSCAILSDGQYQWLHTAYLNVTTGLATEISTTVESSKSMGELGIPVGVGVAVSVCVFAVVLTGIMFLLRRKWRQKMEEGGVELEQGVLCTCLYTA